MIDTIKEPGKLSLTAVICRVDKGKNSKGSPYLSFVLGDASGQLEAKYWQPSEQDFSTFQAGMVVLAKGEVVRYRDTFQMRINKLFVKEEEKASDYWMQAPRSYESMKEEIDSLLEGMQDESLKAILGKLFKKYGQDFLTYPAATRNHHNFVGGLAYHSLCMVHAAQAILPLYPFLDADLLIAGILCHDFGKIWELSSAVLPSYTMEGNLLGHISLMNAEIDRTARELGIDDEVVILLRHMVLSHHGKMEYGSPVLPSLPEAEVLATLDNLDSRLFMMERHLDNTAEGGFTLRDYALDNRMIYKRKR